MGISQPKVSDMMRGNFANLSERKLMDCLTTPTSWPRQHEWRSDWFAVRQMGSWLLRYSNGT